MPKNCCILPLKNRNYCASPLLVQVMQDRSHLQTHLPLSHLDRTAGCCWCCLWCNARLWSSRTRRARSLRGWWWSPAPGTRRAAAPAAETTASCLLSRPQYQLPRSSASKLPAMVVNPLRSRGSSPGPSSCSLSLPLSTHRAFNSYNKL